MKFFFYVIAFLTIKASFAWGPGYKICGWDAQMAVFNLYNRNFFSDPRYGFYYNIIDAYRNTKHDTDYYQVDMSPEFVKYLKDHNQEAFNYIPWTPNMKKILQDHLPGIKNLEYVITTGSGSKIKKPVSKWKVSTDLDCNVESVQLLKE